MELTLRQKAAIVTLVAAIAIVLAYPLLQQKDAPVSDTEFFRALVFSSKVGIVMDVRGAESSAVSDRIILCGVELAGSPKLAGKNITNYACNDEKCITASTSSNWSRSLKYGEVASELSSDGSVYFRILPGPNNTTFYKNHAEIAINDKYPTACSIN